VQPIFALYSLVVYLVAMLTILYGVGFVENWIVPKSIDTGQPGAILGSMAIDGLLLVVFAVQHSLMARPAFKRWWTRIVPSPIERSTYVLASSLALILLFAAWRPLPAAVWTIESSPARELLFGLYVAGWAIVVLSTFMINHYELFGLKQALARRPGAKAPATLTARYLYRFVRHPIMLGFLIAFWATPMMSQGHLLFAVVMTGYIMAGTTFEERDLIALFGDRYRDYRARVPGLVPWRRPR